MQSTLWVHHRSTSSLVLRCRLSSAQVEGNADLLLAKDTGEYSLGQKYQSLPQLCSAGEAFYLLHMQKSCEVKRRKNVVKIFGSLLFDNTLVWAHISIRIAEVSLWLKCIWFFKIEVSVFHRQSSARVPWRHHVSHAHLCPVLLRLRAPSKLLQERGPEFHSHLWIHKKGCCLQSKALLSQGREAVLTVHWAFPLLQKVSCGPSLPSELCVCCSEGRVWPLSEMGCAAFWICWISLRTSLTEVRVVKFTFKFLPVVSSPFAETLIFCYQQSFIQEGKCCQVPVMSGQMIQPANGIHWAFYLCHSDCIKFWKEYIIGSIMQYSKLRPLGKFVTSWLELFSSS